MRQIASQEIADAVEGVVTGAHAKRTPALD